MDIYRNRFASRGDILAVVAVTAFPIYVWAILRLLNEIPAAILRLSIWDLIGLIAYTLAFAFVESLAASLVLVFLAAILPRQLLLERFVAHSTVLVFISAGWFILVHQFEKVVSQWGVRQLLPWFVLFLVSLVFPYLIVCRFDRIEKLINSFSERLRVLSSFYFILSLVGFGIVLIRNLAAS